MKRLNITVAETFIKKLISRERLAALLATSMLFASFSGVVTTEAYAPAEDEITAIASLDLEEQAEAMVALAEQLIALAHDKEEILWLARVIYSETKLESEMPLIAWVVRNRVETGHRSYDAEKEMHTYKATALSRSQFSGLHVGLDRHATHNLSMSYHNGQSDRAWQNALRIAEEVYYSDGSDRLFSTNVRHFYSPVAIAAPAWAYSGTKVHETPGRRFAFYANVI